MAAREVVILTSKSLEFRRRTNLLELYVAQQVYSNSSIENETLETWLPKYLTDMEDIVKECHLLVENALEKLLPTIRWHCWELTDIVPSISDVQQWYSQLIDICLHLQESMGKIQEESIPWHIRSLWFDRVTRAFQELINCHNCLLANPIVVSSQPSEILRTTKISSIQVTPLCGNRFFQPGTVPAMKAILINEEQAKKVHEFGFPTGIQRDRWDGNGEMCETSGTLTDSTTCLSSVGKWEFMKLSIKTVQRKKISHTDSVLEEKFCFLVYTTTPLEGNRIWWCCSRPFFVTVNNSQNSKVATLAFIEESFRVRNRKPFDVPESVTCSNLIAALEQYFMRMTNCQRGFTPTNKAFLRSKLLKHARAECAQDPLVNLKILSEKEGDFKFTFFKWFTGIIEVVNAHLKSYWENDLIIGFIDRVTTENLLTRVAHDGAFIVRFSESKLSSITISYTFEISQKFVTESLEPFTSTKLESLSLPEILHCSRIHQRALTKVYFYQVNNDHETLTSKLKSAAFPVLSTREQGGKPATSSRRGYVKWDVEKSVVANTTDESIANVADAQDAGKSVSNLQELAVVPREVFQHTVPNNLPTLPEPSDFDRVFLPPSNEVLMEPFAFSTQGSYWDVNAKDMLNFTHDLGATLEMELEPEQLS